jgi:TRAP transporter TAXI family solute receptor
MTARAEAVVRLNKVLTTLVACMGLALSACGSDVDSTGDSDTPVGPITIATNQAGTHTYAVAAGLAKLIQEDQGIRTTIRPFSGSSAYLPQLQRGEMELGLNTSIDSYLSFRGLPPYQTPMRNLRALGMMFPLNIMFMVRADSDLTRIEDLRGQRVVVTFRANAALEQLHRGILATGGLDLDDIQPMTVAGLPEAMAALQEGRADAVPTGLNTALSLQVDAALPDGIRYLTMGQDEARLKEIMPGTRIITVAPGPNRVGIEAPIRVSSVPDMLNTGSHISEELAYAIVRSIHSHWGELEAELSQLRGMTSADIAPDDNMHPYHPGAARYFREVGLWTDAHEANQQALLEIAATR